MSYILEALADSEQARQQIAAGPKYSLLPVAGEERPQPRRWPYALAGALLVNAAVLQVWLHSTPPDDSASINAAPAAQPAQRPAAASNQGLAASAPRDGPAANVAVAAITRPATSAPESRRVDDARVARAAERVNVMPRTGSASPANAKAEMKPMPKPVPEVVAKRSAETAAAPQANPMPSSTLPSSTVPAAAAAGSTAESPPGLHHELPPLSVAGFIRGEGSGSMVIVNDRLLREGDEAAPGVKLESISNDGLVFSYKGKRFRR